ncbi:MAG: TspO/MBR family protein [Pseudomonadota bacterium]|uniref:TspO/MBR family protein n=1 Tax=Roseibium aggregatum TaxID=187304 RepID=UPI001E29CD51|nr:TspO/MBR family protein [Roseibium aggregatum]MEC9404111.1 TspO/MBR family protein [Pseudomonadota bacterium]
MKSENPISPSFPKDLPSLVLFLAVVLGVGITIGVLNTPGAWYEALQKPPFNPPNWVFAPAWTILYILIAIAGWRTFLRAPDSRVMKIWYGQMVLNWIWSPLFFTLHFMWTAFAVIAAMLYLILNFIGGSWQTDRLSAQLFIPYALWTCFAGILNLSLALLN